MIGWLTTTAAMKAVIEPNGKKSCSRLMIKSTNLLLSLFVGLLSMSAAWASVPGSHTAAASRDVTFHGMASWYGKGLNGRKTASGEIFHANQCTAAHRTLHLVTKLLVENPESGKSAIVRVNDRGPFTKRRILDLSREAAMKTGIFQAGIGYIECTVIGQEHPR